MLVAIGNPVTFPQMGHSRSRTKKPFFLELQYCINKGERKGAIIFQFQNMTSKIRNKYVWKAAHFTFCYLIKIKTKCLVTAVRSGGGSRRGFGASHMPILGVWSRQMVMNSNYS